MRLRKLAAICIGIVMACSSLGQTALAEAAETTATRDDANVDPYNSKKTDELLTIALPSEPAYAFGVPVGNLGKDNVMLQGIYLDSLVRRDKQTGEILPGLAADWEWIDEKHIRFSLRDDVVMADGSYLTSADVLFTAKCWVEQNGTNNAGKYIDLAGCSAEDEHTVVIGFNVIAPDMLVMLSWNEFGIMSESAVAAVGGLEAAAVNPVVGSGKYIFKEWVRGERMIFERNENYWDDEYAGYFKELKFTFISDASSRQMSVLSGDADVAYEIPVSMAKSMEENQDVKTWIYSGGSVYHMFYNIGSGGPLADIRVRQAIDKALNYDALAAVGTGGYGTKSFGYIDEANALHTQTYTEEEKQIDIDGAKQLLEESGYADGLSLTAVILQEQMPAWVVIQENLRAIGIDLTINNEDVSKWVEDAIVGNYDLILVDEYIDARNPAIFTFFQWSSVNEGFLGGDKWTTDELDGMITEAVQTSDEEEAKAKVTEIEQYLKENMLESDLYQGLNAMITSKNLKGLRTNNNGMMNPAYFYYDE